MVTNAAVRKLALVFPESEERGHFGRPSFRVRNKIFATLWPGERRAVLKLSLADQTGLVGSDPQAFSLNAWSKQGWTNVHLQHVSAKELRGLLERSWRAVAPKTLVRVYDEKEEP